MLRTGLRVSECPSLCSADLRLTQDPPIISLGPDVQGNKAEQWHEVPAPADLVWNYTGGAIQARIHRYLRAQLF